MQSFPFLYQTMGEFALVDGTGGVFESYGDMFCLGISVCEYSIETERYGNPYVIATSNNDLINYQTFHSEGRYSL